MTFKTLETIYYLLQNEMEERHAAYNDAKIALDDAINYEDDPSRISSLELDVDSLKSAFWQVRDAFNEFKSISWN